jgi:hypothetical protein
VHHHFGHSTRRTVTRALEDHVLHLAATKMLNPLLSEDPRNRVGYVALAAAVWANDGGDSIPCEDYFSVVGEGFKPGDFQTLEFEHLLVHGSVLGQPLRLMARRREVFRTGEPL